MRCEAVIKHALAAPAAIARFWDLARQFQSRLNDRGTH